MKTKFFLFLSVLLTISSCTIEKRRYTKGFHVQWNHQLVNHKVKAVQEKQQEKLLENEKLYADASLEVGNSKAKEEFSPIPQEEIAKTHVIVKTKEKVIPSPIKKEEHKVSSPLAKKEVKYKGKLENKNPPSWWERNTIFVLEKSLRNSLTLSILAALLIALVVSMFDIIFLNLRGFALGAVIFLALITVASPIMTSVFGDPMDVLPVLLKVYFTVLIVALPSIIIGTFSIVYSNVRT